MASLKISESFLGVEASVMGRRWSSRLTREGEGLAEALSTAHGYDPLLARVLAGRGVSVEAAPGYLAPKLRDLLPEPYSLLDMEAATLRLAEAIQAREQIAIFGDYDVDGACSSALLAEFLVAAGAPAPFIHIPDRITEGYGPNVEAIEALAERGATLLVTLDCGTVSFEPLARARALGLSTLVIDHHQAAEALPDALVVNPNRQDDLSGQGALCAAGLVFLTLVAVSRELRKRDHWASREAPDLLEALDLAALATVADVAPLTGLNRALVAGGLGVMRGRRRLGLAALMDAARMDGRPSAWRLGFVLGPRINAGGRIGDAGLGARLLLERDPAAALAGARELDRLNGERQALEKATVALAIDAAEEALARSNRISCLVLGAADWHPGVLGLVAAKLKERFKIPSFALNFKGEIASGSGRGLSGVDLGKAVRGAVQKGLAERGGGHAMAAGVTVARDKLDAFRDFMNETLESDVETARQAEGLWLDGAVTARGASLERLRLIEQAGPYGQGNSEPVFALPAHRLAFVAPVGDSHLRARFTAGDGAGVDAMLFRAADTPLGAALSKGRGGAFHVALRLSVGEWRGTEKVDALLVDLAPASSS
ncbi:single-stranded-DNA-specific exonuclease [Methylocystis bryophila]|nr:single-stranded-DNA-specific exonuclease [Methylocystis bryophila]